jgi:hypothetical protein
MIFDENEQASGRRSAPPKDPSNTAPDDVAALSLEQLYDDPAVFLRVGNVIAGAVRRAPKS